MPKQIVVSIADMKVSSSPDEILITYSLGSCIAISLYEPYKKVGGMIHIMLPDSSIETNRSKLNPFKFVDTGVPLLYKKLFALGAKRGHIITKLIGGSNVMDRNRFFNIGERNYTAIRKILWRNNILVKAEDIGGSKSSTVKLFLDSGKVIISNASEVYEI